MDEIGSATKRNPAWDYDKFILALAFSLTIDPLFLTNTPLN